jgi:hypothetical protein
MLTLRDVAMNDVGHGLDIDGSMNGAHVDADGVTLDRALHSAIAVKSSADASLKNVLIRDSHAIGLIALAGAHINLIQALISGSDDMGLVLTGGSGTTPDRLDRVAVIGATGAGITVAGAGTIVEGTLLLVSSTRSPASGSGGDGIFVTSGGQLTLDRTIGTDAERGHGSWSVHNARTGILVGQSASTGEVSRLALFGGHVTDNLAQGLFAQRNALVASANYSEFRRNAGAGVMISAAASIHEIKCNAFESNVTATIPYAGASATVDGSGVVIAETVVPAMMTQLAGNQFRTNTLFAGLFVHASLALQGNMGLSAAQPFAIDSATVFMGIDPTTAIPSGANIPTGTQIFTEPTISGP